MIGADGSASRKGYCAGTDSNANGQGAASYWYAAALHRMPQLSTTSDRTMAMQLWRSIRGTCGHYAGRIMTPQSAMRNRTVTGRHLA